MSYVGLCRHNRVHDHCEQCQFESHEQAKRFDQHVAENLRRDREAYQQRESMKKKGRIYG